ncbi:MAG: AAA family ATPase [bacterium]
MGSFWVCPVHGQLVVETGNETPPLAAGISETAAELEAAAGAGESRPKVTSARSRPIARPAASSASAASESSPQEATTPETGSLPADTAVDPASAEPAPEQSPALDPERATLPVVEELTTIIGVLPRTLPRDFIECPADFTGRQWVCGIVDDWLEFGRKRTMVITGAAGLGKSALAAWLGRTRDDKAAIYFCRGADSCSLRPHEFVVSLIQQLSTALPGFAELVADRQPARCRASASEAFKDLVVEPCTELTRRQARPRPLLIIIDSLHEAMARDGETVLDLLVERAESLPAWARFLVTAELTPELQRRLARVSHIQLDLDRVENRDDLFDHLRRRLADATIPDREGVAELDLAQTIAARVAGNFMQAQVVLGELAAGRFTLADLNTMSPEPSVYYAWLFHSRFGDLQDYRQEVLPLLQALTAAGEPLPSSLLARVVGGETARLRQPLRALAGLLREERHQGKTTYTLRHDSVRGWLTDFDQAGPYWVDPTAGHSRLAELLLPDWRDHEYTLHWLPTHLVSGGRWRDLKTILFDYRFLKAKIDTVGAQALIDDCETVLRQARRGLSPLSKHDLEMFRLIRETLLRAAHLFAADDEQHVARLLGRFLDSQHPEIHTLLAEIQPDSDHAWLRPGLGNLFAQDGPQPGASRGHTELVTAVAAFGQGLWAVSASADASLKIWELESGQEVLTLAGHDGMINGVASFEHSARIISCASDECLKVWDLKSGSEIRSLEGHTAAVNAVALFAGGTRAVSAASDRTLKLWNLETSRVIRTLDGHTDDVNAVAVFTDGRRVLSAAADRTLRVWDLDTSSTSRILVGHTGSVNSVAMSRDGTWAVSGGADGSLLLWDLETGTAVRALTGHTAAVFSVWIDSGERRIFSAALDETLRAWDLKSGAELGCFSQDTFLTAFAPIPELERIVVGDVEGRVYSMGRDWLTLS